MHVYRPVQVVLRDPAVPRPAGEVRAVGDYSADGTYLVANPEGCRRRWAAH